MAEKSGVEQLMVKSLGLRGQGFNPLYVSYKSLPFIAAILGKKLARNGQKEPLVSFEFRATALMKV